MNEIWGKDSDSDNPAPQQPPGHGGRRDEAARRYGIPREELLDFSASINLMGPPPPVLAAVRGAVTEISHYPEEAPAALAAAAATYMGVFPDELVLGNGSTELIYWLATLLSPRRVLIVEPTFSEYRNACLAAGARCDSFMLSEEDGFAFDVSRLDPEGYDLVFLCNPNNPTGYLVPLEDLTALWRRCHGAGAGLVVDEAFIDFADAEESVLSYGVSRGLFVLRSLTKSHALAGLRLGCLAASADFAQRLRQRIPPWNVNSFAVAAGQAALADHGYIEAARLETTVARSMLFEDLSSQCGVEPLPSEANFLLCRLHGVGSRQLSEHMASEGILVRDCRSFAGLGDRYIRVAVRGERENYQLLSALRRSLEQLGAADRAGKA